MTTTTPETLSSAQGNRNSNVSSDGDPDNAPTHDRSVSDVQIVPLSVPKKRPVGRPRKRLLSTRNGERSINSSFERDIRPKELAKGDRGSRDRSEAEGTLNEQKLGSIRQSVGRPLKKGVLDTAHSNEGQKSSRMDIHGEEKLAEETKEAHTCAGGHKRPLAKDRNGSPKRGTGERENEGEVVVAPRTRRRTGRARRRGAASADGKRGVIQFFNSDVSKGFVDKTANARKGRDERANTPDENDNMVVTGLEMSEDLEEEAEVIEVGVETRRGNATTQREGSSPQVLGKGLHPFFRVNSGPKDNIERGGGEGPGKTYIDVVDRVEEWIDDTTSEEEVVSRRQRKRVAKEEDAEKELHPFFRETAVAVMKEKGRVKRQRVSRPLVDAWMYNRATIHVNYNQALGPWERPFQLWKDIKCAKTTDIELGLKRRQNCLSDGSLPRKEIVSIPDVSPDLWAEKFKLNNRIDVISASATTELVDWLRHWYAENEELETSEHQSDTDSDASLEGLEETGKETLAIITGPVGCGKSTVVANAARSLGLSVLEINASSCRTGKRVRDVVREALRTHRVASRKTNAALEGLVLKKKNGSSGSDSFESANARTLILFEEVDELHEDEKGFWGCIQELADSRECRRPIVCTANKFSHLMRQWFDQDKGPAETDMSRLLINTKFEQIPTPVMYKHITLPTRTEKQARAVLNEVVATECIEVSQEALSCLAVTIPRDSRRAVNSLQFWGLRGLSDMDVGGKKPLFFVCSPRTESVNVPPHPDVSMLRGLTDSNLSEVAFHVATRNIIEGDHRGRLRRGDAQLEGTFAKWSASLEILSLSDNVLHATAAEVQHRCLGFGEDSTDFCMDSDLQHCVETAQELIQEAVSYSVSDLQHGEWLPSIEEIGRACIPRKSVLQPPDGCARSRRPIVSEYLPALRTMAVNQGKSSRDGARPKRSLAELSSRRTRASLRRGGFHSLDLDPSTVLALNRDYLGPEE